MRLNPNWDLAAVNRSGYSNAHSAHIEVERRYSNGLAFQWYTFAGSLTTIQFHKHPATPHPIQQRLRSVLWARPSLWGNVRRLLDHLIGGWQIAAIGDWRSGLWRSVSPSLYLFGDPTLSHDRRVVMTIFGKSQRLWFRGYFDPTQASNVSQPSLEALVPLNRTERVLRPLGSAFDNRLLQQLADGTIRLTPIGDAVNPNARAFYLGPGSWNVDVAVVKSFKLTEKMNARFSADFFNVFNHPNDVDPDIRTGLQDFKGPVKRASDHSVFATR